MKLNRRVDSNWAWVVAFASCWVNFSIYGLWRAYGVLFVAFIRDFGVTHQTASWPFTLCCAVYHLIGPVVGLLNQKYSLRLLQSIGCIVASFGVMLTYFANDFFMVIVFIGAVQGLGLGVIRTLSNVIIQQYFRRHRATATGIAMAGGTISSFFFPTFAEFILSKFGLKISFLVFGSIMMQALIGIYVQWPPTSAVIICKDDTKQEAIIETNVVSVDSNETKTIAKNGEAALCLIAVNDQNSNELLINGTEKLPKVTSTKIDMEFTAIDKEKETALSILINVLTQPTFMLICALFVVYNICLQVYLMTIVDMVLEKKITNKSNAIMLITIFSVADLIGRVSFGWISDKGFAKPKNIAIACQILLAFALILTPLMRSSLALYLCSILVGILIGIITILWPILNVDFFGTDKLAISLGLNCFFSGAESLVRPFVIGFYLDYLKSYDLLYFTMSALISCTCALWLCEPLLNNSRKSGV